MDLMVNKKGDYHLTEEEKKTTSPALSSRKNLSSLSPGRKP
jgi:hypothetical protein